MGPNGLLISLEGVDGSGKTTQARRLAEALRQTGWPVVLTREPGGTPLGKRLREMLLRPSAGLVPNRPAELLLYLADRAQHLQEVVEPALKSQQVVVVDRFIDSTLAYQGVARGFGIEALIEVHRVLGILRWPDCTLLLEVDPRRGLERKRRTVTSAPEWSRWEQEDPSFHEAVAAGYRRLAAMFPDRIEVVPAEAEPDVVFEHIRTVLRRRFPWLWATPSRP